MKTVGFLIVLVAVTIATLTQQTAISDRTSKPDAPPTAKSTATSEPATKTISTKPESNPESALIASVPHVRQKPDFCGEACVEMYLRKLGVQGLDQDAIFDASGLDPMKGRGCYTRELVTALKLVGFQVGQAGYSIQVKTAARDLDAHFKSLHEDLLAGTPSIVCMHYSDTPNTTEHFRLIVGYDAKSDEVIYHEPAVENGAYQRMSRKLLLKLWPLKYSTETWTVIRMPLKGGEKIASRNPPTTFTSADYAQHIMKLKPKVPKGFQYVIQPPFVVLGDESLSVIKRRAIGTVKWATDRLKKDFFSRDPEHIIDVWLFKDKASYRKHTHSVFNDRPTTPYGYYSSTHRALIMNISTGGGTLVHEIVHPFMASNFKGCPSWFNEGLASLYEQSADRDGHIRGLTNWRLAGLQKALQAKTVPSFKQLCGTTRDEFYDKDPGTNYSQARYLCYYLQERGLLRKFYAEFTKSADKDPTGYKTLERVLGERDMATFRKKWEASVMSLRF